MASSLINSVGKVTQLDGRAGPPEVVTEADVQEPAKLARAVQSLLLRVATLERTRVPQRIDFEDIAVSTAGAQVSLAHGMNGRVRWWIVGWRSSGTAAPILRESPTTITTANTLYLQSYVAGTATIRVELA